MGNLGSGSKRKKSRSGSATLIGSILNTGAPSNGVCWRYPYCCPTYCFKENYRDSRWYCLRGTELAQRYNITVYLSCHSSGQLALQCIYLPIRSAAITAQTNKPSQGSTTCSPGILFALVSVYRFVHCYANKYVPLFVYVVIEYHCISVSVHGTYIRW